jgi:hypothetical protein
MNKGQVIKFSDLQIGDYFSDNERQKYRKIPEFNLDFEPPNFQAMVINAFHIQSNAIASVNPDDEFVFIAHSAWNPQEHKYQFEHSTEKLELEHQIEFFTNYFEILKESLNSIETSNDFFDPDESFSSNEVDEFTDLMRSSFFVSLYSYLEAQLNKECQFSQQDNAQIKVLLDDIHGSGINRAKIYLVKVLNTSFPFDNDSAWEKIQWFGKIRNCIVHAEGKVKDSNLKKYIENHPNLHCEMRFGNDIVVLDEGFCEKAIAVIGAFLQSLLYHRQADKVG